MSEMIERVQEAINALLPVLGEDATDDSREIARAAIAAMREPSKAMVDNGATECGVLGAEDSAFDSAKWCWQAMIDTALAEEP